MNDNPSLNQIIAEVTQNRSKNTTLPPVLDWNPPFKGDMDMRIAVDGRWYYEGGSIDREALVRLFSSILKLEADGCYYLVTPVEKFRIQVEDAPFIATQMKTEGVGESQQLIFTTNVGDQILASKDFPITIKIDDGGNPRPYILVRQNLKALISRNVFYQLVDLGEEIERDDKSLLGIWSAGEFFELGELGDTG